ncbi:MAG TPA: PAS domain-containing protein, partial [Thermoleophilia bacterium]|nr:PAS domain-containing protein [Thermoleophilia bacterium]
MFGLSPDAHVEYETFLEHVYPEDRQRVHEAVQQALDPDGSGEFESEYRASWPDRSQHWILATGKAFFGEVGGERRARRFIGIVLDIGARKAAQQRPGLPGGRESRESEAARFGVRLTEGFLGRAVFRFRGHKLQVLLVSCAVETGFLAAMGAASHSRQVFGLPGSVMALTVVVAGAL